jgi:hypothetical protein
MKRFHMHVGVKNIEESVQFYSTLFGQQPAKIKTDYAKWMLEDPKINFAISTRTNDIGIDHLGIQVEKESELEEITDLGIYDEGETTCCYANSNKAWVTDPSGIAWEAYQNMGDVEVFSKKDISEKSESSSCCVPKVDSKTSCC